MSWNSYAARRHFREAITRRAPWRRAGLQRPWRTSTVRDEAKDRSLKVIDATCPLVTQGSLEALKFAAKNANHYSDWAPRPPGNRRHLGRGPDRTIVVDSVDAVDALEVVNPTSFLS